MADPKSFFLSSEAQAYLVAHGATPDQIQQELIAETVALGEISMMQISPEQGAFMTNFTRLVGARRAIEVGTFTGYSALCIARGLPDDGALLCCDVSEEWTAVGRKAWAAAGVADKITLEIAPALDTLRALPSEPVFDLGFIDADKASYLDYFEEILIRLKPNGVVLVDNVLWGGAVLDASSEDPNTVAIRAFNDAVAADERVESTILTIGDGLTVARKR